MKRRELKIAIFGTFDVENFGDLLFPVIAEAELQKRLGPISFHRFSYHSKSPPLWPFAVTSVVDFPLMADTFDGILIGGGFIIRFDKYVAPDYAPSALGIHHPTGYWLTPAMIALQYGVPVIWNAPGMHCNDIPEWSAKLVKLCLNESRYISVRDEPSRQTLSGFAGNVQIKVLPDTGFGISRLIDPCQPSAELHQLREQSGLTKPFIIIQAARHGLDVFLRAIRKNPELFQDFQFLALPIGPALGDHASHVGTDLPGFISLSSWPAPLLLAELISQAEAVAGHSYHLAIIAQAFGIPVFSSAELSEGKYTAIAGLETIFPLKGNSDIDAAWIRSKLGRRPICQGAEATLEMLDMHWNKVAASLMEGKTDSAVAVSRFLQDLPNLLEIPVIQADVQRLRIDDLVKHLSLANEQLKQLHDSHSFKMTAPFRSMMRYCKVLLGR